MIPIAHDVFISYSRADTGQAMLVKQTLEQNGISCWFDDRDIPPGANYAIEISQGVKQAKVFLLMLSTRSNQSQWVERELECAAKNRLFIIPYLLENFEPDESFQFFISSANYLHAWKDPEQARRRLAAQIRQQLHGDSEPERPIVTELPFWEKKPEKKVKKPAMEPKKRLKVAAIALAGLALLLGALGIGGMIREKTQISRALEEAAAFAQAGDYHAALDRIGSGRSDYPESEELRQAQEQYQAEQAAREKTLAMEQARLLSDEGDYAGALELLEEYYAAEPEDSAIAALYAQYADGYSAGVVETAEGLVEREEYAAALVALRDGLRRLPEDAAMLEAFNTLAEQNPVPLESSSVAEQHYPDDATIVVSCGSWDPNSELDINMNKWNGGLRVCVGDLVSNAFSFVQAGVNSRVAWQFSPSNHTETTFTGYIVLGDGMYGRKTYGTIRILVDGVEVFTTGRIDGSSPGVYPFEVDITGVDTIIFEAEVKLVDWLFEYGIVG